MSDCPGMAGMRTSKCNMSKLVVPGPTPPTLHFQSRRRLNFLMRLQVCWCLCWWLQQLQRLQQASLCTEGIGVRLAAGTRMPDLLRCRDAFLALFLFTCFICGAYLPGQTLSASSVGTVLSIVGNLLSVHPAVKVDRSSF